MLNVKKTLTKVLEKITAHDVDYIVEQGTSGIWTYRKWASGVAECWGVHSATLSHYVAALGGYGYYTGDILFPTNFFSATPNVYYTTRVGSGLTLTGNNGSNTNNSKCVLYAVSSTSGSQSTNWYIYAIGKYVS